MSKRPARSAASEGIAKRQAFDRQDRQDNGDSFSDGGAGAFDTKPVRVSGSDDEADIDYQQEHYEAQEDDHDEEDYDDYESAFDSDSNEDSEDDQHESSRSDPISEEEKQTVAIIMEKLMVPVPATFMKTLTKGLCAFVICTKRVTPTLKDKVDILSHISFYKETLSEASRKLICEQTMRAMQQVDLSKIKEESHMTFYALANFRRTRIVAAMIADIDTVVAGILVLQLSLAQIAAGRTMGEPFESGALEEQNTLIQHLLSLPPLQGVAQICFMVIANSVHVQRRKIKSHIYSTRPPQLFDKRPVSRGVATRAKKVGRFLVRVFVAVPGDMPAQGGCDAITSHFGAKYNKSGIVSLLPAEDFTRPIPFPFKKTSYTPPPPPLCSNPVFQFCLATLSSKHKHTHISELSDVCMLSRYLANEKFTDAIVSEKKSAAKELDSGMVKAQQKSIVDAFLDIISTKGTNMRKFLDTIRKTSLLHGKCVTRMYGIPMGAMLCVRIGNNQAYQRFAAERLGCRIRHKDFDKIESFPRQLPMLLKLDATSTRQDIAEMLPLWIIARGSCKIECTLILPELGVKSIIRCVHYIAMSEIRETHFDNCAHRAMVEGERQKMVDLKAANKETKERIKAIKASATAKNPGLSQGALNLKVLKKNEIQAEVSKAGKDSFDYFKHVNSLTNMVVIKEGVN